MANFKTTLEALAKGEIELESISSQITKILEQSPQHALKLLSDLDEVYGNDLISDQHYAELKRQINQYRKSHATATETGEVTGDATVFAQEDNISPQPQASGDSEEVTQIDKSVQGDLSHDSTQVLGDESTRIMDTAPETTDMEGFDVTGGSDMSGVDIDISAVDRGIESTSTAASGPTDTGWSDPSAGAYQPGMELGPGSVIKHRFKLLKVLGVGGMGKVYQGIDLLKEEARDRNPYVAIKLLNEDFKDHPEAFISLQRESSRQQKLAHPNIATVYDFDRIGGPGTPVFITMELMEGMELKDFIKKKVKKEGGLPFEEAFDIIKQLVAALNYAHERRLVHSDFKPGNAFLCNDGTVKTLDFGIARAVKNPVTGEAEKTLFDPGKLGALTPAYASLEMLQGEEPDTRDDIYALGCVAYELLTGKHPFNKLPANKAMENNLIPANVKGLKKKQNRALRRAVAFHRKDRPQTVNDFLEEFEAKFIWYKNPVVIAAIILIVTAIGATKPTLDYMHKKEIDQVIADIKTGSEALIVSKLENFEKYERSDRLRITDEAKDAIQGYLKTKIAALIDTSGNDYNFPEAELIVKQAGNYYPGSAFITNQTELVNNAKKRQLSELYNEFSDALASAKDEEDPSLLASTKSILDIIRNQVDPGNALLTDARPSNLYRIMAEHQFDLGNLDTAMSLVTSGLELTPDNQQLIDSKNKIETQITIVSLQTRIENIQGQLNTLADYKQHEQDIVQLTELSPNNPVLSPVTFGMQALIDQEIQTILTSGTRADAENLSSEYGTLLSSLQLGRELSQIKLAHLTGAERTQIIQKIVADDEANIEQLIASPALSDGKWKSELLANIQELDSLSSEDPTITQGLAASRQTIARLYIDEARKTLESNRFDVANTLIDSGEQFAPNMDEIFNARNEIAEAKALHEKQIAIEGLKGDLKVATEGNDVVRAVQIFEELKAEMDQEDAFITTEAPRLISKSYEVLAANRFNAKDYVNALKLADEGLNYHPGNVTLKEARKDYVVEANIIELDKLFGSKIAFNTGEVNQKIGEIANSPRFSEFRQKSISKLESRINQLRTSDENAAATLAQNAAIVFPGTVLEKLKDELAFKPWPNLNVANTALNAGKLTEATNILQEAAAEYTNHPDVVNFQEELQSRIIEANDAFSAYKTEKKAAADDYDKLRASKKFLLRAQSIWTDNPDYTQEETDLDNLIADNKPAPKVIKREEVDLTVATAPAKPGEVKKEWKPLSSGRECEPKLAGYGRRSKAVCYDLVNDGWRGPLMVVVPSGSSFNNGFAISRYEVSVGDYAKYCALSGKCKPETNPEKLNDPIRNITIKEAEAYVAWLSERTGKTYRLPTAAEWTYAADADGQQPKKDYNCRVALGDKVIKGTGIVSVKSGQANGWGLKNYIGNVQEWVVDGSNIKVLGGAFEDAHSKCDISLERTHNGSADEQTGFRIILEELG